MPNDKMPVRKVPVAGQMQVFKMPANQMTAIKMPTNQILVSKMNVRKIFA
jgi:hypothetical protein